MTNYPVYVGGRFKTTGQILNVVNPFDQSLVAQTYLCGESEIEESIKAARSVRKELGKLSSFEKSRILRQIAESMIQKKEHLSSVLSLESAKPIRFALAEIDRAIQTFLIASEECKRIPKEYISLDWTPNGKGREGLIKYFPIGIVAGISPFNFPMNLAVHKIAPAIASGCPILLKPASSTPLSVLELAKIIDETDLPKGAASILPMNRKEGNRLVTDDRISLLSFTGSPEVGWEMKKNAGKKKVILELGGNAGVIVSKTADISKIIDQCINGGFAYSGQICIHAQRFFIHESKFDAFVELFRNKVSQLKFGNPSSSQTDVSCMIDEANAKRVESWVHEAIQQGASLIVSGKRKENYMEPVVLTGTNSGMKVHAEEVFGPVVCIEKFSTIQEAIDMVNDSKFGLQCGLFSDSHEEIEACFQGLEVGGLILNDVPTLRFDHMPYGGVKESGLGREGVKYAIMDMLEPRILVK